MLDMPGQLIMVAWTTLGGSICIAKQSQAALHSEIAYLGIFLSVHRDLQLLLSIIAESAKTQPRPIMFCVVLCVKKFGAARTSLV